MTTPLLPGDPPAEEQLIAGGKVMSVFDHLAELRMRIVRSLWSVVLLFCVAFYFADELINELKKPLLAALPQSANGLHFTGPLDVFMTDMKVALLVSVVAACPIWLYQFWRFFEPALYPRERRYILPFIVASVLMFAVGISFAYFVILPTTLKYLIGMGMEVGTPIITIKDYIHLLTLTIFGFGAVFETPVLIVLLAMLDILTLQTLTSSRRFVVIAVLIIAAIVTPSPDPVSQLALAVPVYLMYEMAIVIIRVLKGREGAKAA